VARFNKRVHRMRAESSFEARTYAKVDWRLIPFLFLCYILAYLDRVNVGFAKLQMLKDLNLSEAAFATGIGVVNSVDNLGGYIGPNIPIWVKGVSTDPSAALYAIAASLFVGAVLAYVFIPANLAIQPRPDTVSKTAE
jgi:sugar phosphate permease